jgi:hypothetical protein
LSPGLLIRLAALSTALAVLVLPSTGVAGTGPATITITNVQTAFKMVDVGARGQGAGDLEIIGQALYNRRVTPTPIGHADVLCTLLSRTRRSCTTTYTLPRGRIMTAGVIDTRLIYELAIVGGTELYDNARGSLVVTTTALNPRRQLLVFRLTG